MCLEVPVAVAYLSKCRLKCKPSWADETIRLTSISPTEKGHFRGGAFSDTSLTTDSFSLCAEAGRPHHVVAMRTVATNSVSPCSLTLM